MMAHGRLKMVTAGLKGDVCTACVLWCSGKGGRKEGKEGIEKEERKMEGYRGEKEESK